MEDGDLASGETGRGERLNYVRGFYKFDGGKSEGRTFMLHYPQQEGASGSGDKTQMACGASERRTRLPEAGRKSHCFCGVCAAGSGLGSHRG